MEVRGQSRPKFLSHKKFRKANLNRQMNFMLAFIDEVFKGKDDEISHGLVQVAGFLINTSARLLSTATKKYSHHRSSMHPRSKMTRSYKRVGF